MQLRFCWLENHISLYWFQLWGNFQRYVDYVLLTLTAACRRQNDESLLTCAFLQLYCMCAVCLFVFFFPFFPAIHTRCVVGLGQAYRCHLISCSLSVTRFCCYNQFLLWDLELVLNQTHSLVFFFLFASSWLHSCVTVLCTYTHILIFLSSHTAALFWYLLFLFFFFSFALIHQRSFFSSHQNVIAFPLIKNLQFIVYFLTVSRPYIHKHLVFFLLYSRLSCVLLLFWIPLGLESKLQGKQLCKQHECLSVLVFFVRCRNNNHWAHTHDSLAL